MSQQTDRLIAIMAALRAPDGGCPWDQVQDFATIAPYTIEEAYEVADAIARADQTALQEELGDLLFQVVYHARLAEERGWFGYESIATAIADKMVHRHPHVFGEPASRAAAAHTDAWEAQKHAERAARSEHGTLANIPFAQPALTRAVKLTARAARVGFDWPDAEAVLEKLTEETAELRAEFPAADRPEADRGRLADEYGDMLFVLANLGRKLGLDPETCLRGANQKFTRRFEAIEAALARQGRVPSDSSLPEMERLWTDAKAAERDI